MTDVTSRERTSESAAFANEFNPNLVEEEEEEHNS